MYHQLNTSTAESVSLFIGEQRHHLFILLLSGNSSCNSTNQKSHSSCRDSYSNKTIFGNFIFYCFLQRNSLPPIRLNLQTAFHKLPAF